MDWIEFEIQHIEYYNQGKKLKEKDRQAIKEHLEATYPETVLNELNKINIGIYPNNRKGGTSFNIHVGQGKKIGSARYYDINDRVNELMSLIIEEGLSFIQASDMMYNKYTDMKFSKSRRFHTALEKYDELEAYCNENEIDINSLKR